MKIVRAILGPVRLLAPACERAWPVFIFVALAASGAPRFSEAATVEINPPLAPTPLPGTEELRMTGDIASNLVAGVDRFLLKKIEQSAQQRTQFWRRDFDSADKYRRSVQPNRERLAKILGLSDPRPVEPVMELVETTDQAALVGFGATYQVLAVRWRAFGDVHAEGLLLLPEGNPPLADVIALPDADLLPEQLAGLQSGLPADSQVARRLAESGCRVLVPLLISRQSGQPKTTELKRGASLTNREFIYRSAFELGRTMVGYEVEKILAGVDWFQQQRERLTNAAPRLPRIGVIGWGEGGMLALYAAALDPRIDAACVSGYFQSRNRIWDETIDRNVFGLLQEFGDAEIASLIAPRALIVEAAKTPELTLPSNGGAPAILTTPSLESVKTEFHRATDLIGNLRPAPDWHLITTADGTGTAFTPETENAFLRALGAPGPVAPKGLPGSGIKHFDPASRQSRQVHELDRHNQYLLRESPYVRAEFMKKLDAAASTNYDRIASDYRKIFYRDIIGEYEDALLPPRPRSRKAYDRPTWTGYEVVLDVFPDVIAYGILLLPKDLSPDEKRPVVVCQHGLEGRPQDVVAGDNPAYHDFAARLTEQGFITFAPQNLYIFHDRFRTLQRKSYPLRKTLFSIIIPQHQQIINWLKTLPNVDPHRIAFYGLSYGGKTAMRVPAVLTDYCLSICSADFNEWVWKNASTRSPYSYVWGGEYEIFEWDLGSTFNYAEMAALIAPRPFMVERGHFDGVAPDETVAHEFAKVRFRYEAQLKLKEQTEIEFFVGPHTIHGGGTFTFLHKHLHWPEPTK